MKEGFFKENRNLIIVLAVCLLLVAASVFLRYPKINSAVSNNDDANYHMLLTLTAYSQTPANAHKFLPLVSLGFPEDKNISWGATVQDKSGNYYYTSFYTPGFIAPYIFMKITGMEFTKTSLFWFNSVLYLLCFLLTAYLFVKLFSKYISPAVSVAITALVYLFQPEIMHSQGLVYWHHSLFQAAFLLQLIFFTGIEKKLERNLFLAMCFVNPLIEWTGFIANAGFALAVFLKGESFTGLFKALKTKKIVLPSIIMALSFIALVFMLLHYASVLGWNYFDVVYYRFRERSISSAVTLGDLLAGYVNSFRWLLAFAAVTGCYALYLKKRRKQFVAILKEYKFVLLVLLFPLLENIILLEHAVSYTFDRMKLVYPLLFIIMVFYSVINKNKIVRSVFFIFLAASSVLNAAYYLKPSGAPYFLDGSYLRHNEEIAAEIKDSFNRDNSIIVNTMFPVRGYATLLFGRGVYEGLHFDKAKYIAKYSDKRYIVLLYSNLKYCAVDQYTHYVVYDMQQEKFIK